MKKIIPVVIIAVLASVVCTVVFSGCRKQPQGQEASQRPKIAGIIFQEDQFFRLVQFGMRDAARKAGAELLEASSLNKPDKEIQLVNTYIARKVDAIVISPLSMKASVTALKRAHDKGIKIITYNSTIQGDIPSVYIESDQGNLGTESGKAARKYIEEKLGGKAKVAILAFKSQLPEQSNARSEGFKREITKLAGVEIVAEQDAWLAEAAIKKAAAILTAHPDMNIVWAANEGGTVGAVMAVKSAGKAGKVAVFGTDISEQLIDFLLFEDDILQAITGQCPFEIGSMAVESALKAIKNQRVERQVSVTGVLLTRDDPEAIKAFSKKREELISRGSK
ncbi:MAG: substrate-binding domain-containing protein [Anaerohalosphaeraceae bacterium]|nr:substrate-binding domain-containing protein [Anaerohalosphaeraceae bacterium]